VSDAVIAALLRRRATRAQAGRAEEPRSRAATPSGAEARLPLAALRWEEREFGAAVRRFAEDRVRPRVEAMDRAAELPRDLLDELFGRGLMGIEIPAADGGGGGTFCMTALAIEELARVDPSVALCVDVQNALVVQALLRFGTAEQRARHLPALARDVIGAFALSEAAAGSDAFALETRAERHGDSFVLHGRKMWTTNGAEAGLYVVFAQAGPVGGRQGVTAFLLERSARGLTVGRREDKLGMRASSTCELVLEGVEVGTDALLGCVGGGSGVALETLTAGRIGIAAQLVGLAQGALEAAVAHAERREQFGRPIASYQGVHFPLAEIATEVAAARLLTYEAVRLRETGASFVELLPRAAMAKLFASRVAEAAASRAVEILGGVGVTRGGEVEKYFRDAKVGKIYEGTENMQLQTIASTLVGIQ
jgi:alkylation response protein AidB-like acyl-CoA dehydrogenase